MEYNNGPLVASWKGGRFEICIQNLFFFPQIDSILERAVSNGLNFFLGGGGEGDEGGEL